MKKAGVVVAAVAVVAAFTLGYALRVWQERMDHSQISHLAEEKFWDLKRMGSGPGFECYMPPEWIPYVQPQLDEALSKPWKPVNLDGAGLCAEDYEWAIAYRLKNRLYLELEIYRYQPDMSDQKQDEMIRFICYGIEMQTFRPASWGPCLFETLQTYPRRDQATDRAMVLRAVKKAVKFGNDSLREEAIAFLTQNLPQAWVRQLLWDYVVMFARTEDMRLHRTLVAIQYFAFEPVKGLEPTNPERMKAAREMLVQFCNEKWPDRCGPSVKEVQSQLRLRTSQPASSPN